MSTPTRSFLLVHVFDGIADLKVTHRRVSASVENFNVSWKLELHRTEENVEISLNCDRPNDVGTWSIRVKYDLKIVKVDGNCHSHSMESQYGNDAAPNVYNIPMTFDKLKEDYVVDNKLIIEAHVVIEEMTGIERPKKLRIFDETTEDMSSIVLKVGDEKFYVLKKFLATQSTYFESLHFGEFSESKQSEVTLKDIDPQTFQTFLEMLYLEPSLTDSNIEDVLNLTDMYHTKGGARLCEMFLMCDSNHCLRTKLRIASLYKFEKLKNYCIDSIKCLADVRSVIGPDFSEVDPFYAGGIIEKLLSFSK